MPRTPRCGVGTKCTVLLKYIHPVQLINSKHPNRRSPEKFEHLLFVTKTAIERQQFYYVYRHDEVEGQKLHGVKRWAKVVE